MINTVWESTLWHLDMQVVGKVALSAATLFLFALAYRFYKYRALKRPEEADKHALDPGGTKDEVEDGPRQDYSNDEISNLRYRRVNSNLQNGLVTDPAKKLADFSHGSHKLQEGFETADVIGTNQNDLTEELHNNADLLQSRGHHGDDPTCQNDACDGQDSANTTQKEVCREDPEGREMLEKSEMVSECSESNPKNMTALSSIDLSLIHKSETKKELHRFSSVVEVQMQESIITDDGSPPQALALGVLKGKIYNYHTESTSQTVIAVNPHQVIVCPLQPQFFNVRTTKEEKVEAATLQDPKETTEKESKDRNLEPENISQKTEHISDVSDERTDVSEEALLLGTLPSSTSLSIEEICASSSSTPQSVDEDIQTETQTPEEIIKAELRPKDHIESKEEAIIDRSEGGPPSSFNNSASNTTEPFLSTEKNLKDIQTKPSTYNVSLDPQTTLDLQIDLGNCYEVLSLAKKHNLVALKAAAYKVMSDDYLQVLQNPSVYGHLNATERDLILEGRMKGRRFVVVADIDTQPTSKAQNSSLSYYDNENDVWHPLSPMPSEAVSRGCSMATMFNYLFLALGCDGPERQAQPSRRVLCYNPLTDTWKEIGPLNDARPHCKLVALDGFLYAIGGECLHTVERYDPRQNRWSYIAPLPNDTFAVAHMATAYDDEIFVTGGTIRYMLLRYRERENAWKSSLFSGSRDRTTEMVAADNFLYRFDLNRNMGISVHRCNIRARIWYECGTYPMPYPAPFQCVVLDNIIHCISRNFHLTFLAEDVSPRFMDANLQTVPSPKGALFPFIFALPMKGKY